jgi:hypothetical protein
MVSIVSEYNCSELANHTLYSVITAYRTASSVRGSSSSSSSSSSSATREPPFLLDMHVFIDEILMPVASEIARVI